MSEWKEYKIDSIAKVVGGGTPKTSEPKFWNGSIPWITPRDLTGYSKVYISRGERNITEEGLRRSSAKLLPVGTVLLSSRAPIGYVAITENEISTNQGFKNLVVKRDKANNLFIYYWLKSNVDYIKSNGTGTIFSEISGSVLKQLDIYLPPLPEQKAIAEVLSSLDDKIDLLQRQNKTLEQMAETLFRQWFIEEADESWEEACLEECVDIAIGRTPPRKQSQWFSTDEKDVKWISIKDMGSSGSFIFNTSEYLTKEAVEKFNIPLIPKDTVVLSFKMTVGRVAITSDNMLSNEAIAHFKFHANTPFTKEYLYLFLKTYKYETLGSTSSIVTSINSKMIKKMLITIPDKKTIKTFNEYTQTFFQKIRTNQVQLYTLEKLRDTLLPKLMSGEIIVSNDLIN